MKLQQKAIFVGTLSEGFALACVARIGDDVAQMITDVQRPGQHAEAMDINCPKDRIPRYRAVDDGSDYVLFGSGTGGAEVYGPFPNREAAEEFAERARRDDEEWEVHSA